MANTCPWPSFENLSATYAVHLNEQLKRLGLVATYLQRWVRRDKTPLYGRGGPLKMSDLRQELLDTPLLKEVYAFEKMDGTNFGVRDDGVLFGRRSQATGPTYQKVPVSVAPPCDVVRTIKEEILAAAAIGDASPSFVLYGELMCNHKYGYCERGYARKFVCFGAKFNADGSKEAAELGHRLSEGLRAQGYATRYDKIDGKVTLMACPAFLEVVARNGVAVTPFAAKGSLVEVCNKLCDEMMKNNMEGYVLTGGNGFIRKWKTGLEDESRGASHLEKILTSAEAKCLGADEVLFGQLLHRIATNKPPPKKTAPKIKTAKTLHEQPYSDEVLEKALVSAQSKYDDPSSYFAVSKMKEYKQILAREVAGDLSPSTDEELHCIEQAAGKLMGAVYKAWKAEKKAAN